MSTYCDDPHVITIDPKRDFDWNGKNVKKVCPHCVYARTTPLGKNSNIIKFFNSFPRDMIDTVKLLINKWDSKKVLVIDDSNHLTDTVYENLMLYTQFVSLDSYFLVQDTKMRRLQFNPDADPLSSIAKFFKTSNIANTFIIDRSFEYYILTQHPNGYLKRIK